MPVGAWTSCRRLRATRDRSADAAAYLNKKNGRRICTDRFLIGVDERLSGDFVRAP